MTRIHAMDGTTVDKYNWGIHKSITQMYLDNHSGPCRDTTLGHALSNIRRLAVCGSSPSTIRRCVMFPLWRRKLRNRSVGKDTLFVAAREDVHHVLNAVTKNGNGGECRVSRKWIEYELDIIDE